MNIKIIFSNSFSIMEENINILQNILYILFNIKNINYLFI